MNSEKQTALEWYIEQHNILAKISDTLSNGEIVKRISDIEKQAKEMEKGQMENTWISALEYAIELLKGLHNIESKDAFEKFYKTTYGGNK
jgi:hypothetical protein